MSDDSLYDDVLREVYGTGDSLVNEVYGQGKPRRRRKARPLLNGVRGAAHELRECADRPSYVVTAHARVLCECGSYVYTESRNGSPPALPKNRWRCGRELPA